MSKPRSLVLIKAAIGLTAFGLFSVAAFLALLCHEHGTEISLPYPTGHFAVGRTMYVWADTRLTNEMLVWIWYPSASPRSAPAAEYLPAPWRLGISHLPSRRSASAILMDDFLTRDPAVVRTHSIIDPPVSSEQAAFPVVIMRPGGSALTADLTSLAEDLASHGYIVVGFDAPRRSSAVVFPDGRVVERAPEYDLDEQPAGGAERLAEKLLIMWTADTRFVVDQLHRLNAADPSGRFMGRLDLDRLGVVGHSLGGATALQFCHDDTRCKAGINMDGIPFGSVVREGLSQPFLFLIEGGDFSPAGRARKRDSDADVFFSRIASIYKANQINV
jgi:dienelactone hydrolase